MCWAMLIPYLIIIAVVVALLLSCLERCDECGHYLHTVECPGRNHDRFAL